MMMNDYIRSKIALCLKNFDFDRAVEIMDILKWKLRKRKRPTPEQLFSFAEELLYATYRDLIECGISSGWSSGFHVNWEKDPDGRLECSLSFVVLEADSYVYSNQELPPLSSS